MRAASPGRAAISLSAKQTPAASNIPSENAEKNRPQDRRNIGWSPLKLVLYQPYIDSGLLLAVSKSPRAKAASQELGSASQRRRPLGHAHDSGDLSEVPPSSGQRNIVARRLPVCRAQTIGGAKAQRTV